MLIKVKTDQKLTSILNEIKQTVVESMRKQDLLFLSVLFLLATYSLAIGQDHTETHPSVETNIQHQEEQSQQSISHSEEDAGSTATHDAHGHESHAEHGHADAHHGEHDHGGGSMPQLDPSSFASQIFWLLITFFLLYFIVARTILPRVSSVKDEREVLIEDDKNTAQSLNVEAEEVLAKYKKKLEEARSEAREIVQQASAEVSSKAAEEEKKATSKFASEIEKAAGDINAAKEKAFSGIEEIANDIVQETLGKFISKSPKKADVDKAVTSSLEERK